MRGATCCETNRNIDSVISTHTPHAGRDDFINVHCYSFL